jgi:hypothetical protein
MRETGGPGGSAEISAEPPVFTESLLTTYNELWYRITKWIGMATGLVGAVATANHHVFYGFLLFFISSAIWVFVAARQQEYSLLMLQIGFLIADVYGLWEWM